MISDLSVETDKSSPNLEKNSPGQVLDYHKIRGYLVTVSYISANQ